MRVEFKQEEVPEGTRVRDIAVGRVFVFVNGSAGYVYLRTKGLCYVELGSGDLFHVDEAKGLARLIDAMLVVRARRVDP